MEQSQIFCGLEASTYMNVSDIPDTAELNSQDDRRKSSISGNHGFEKLLSIVEGDGEVTDVCQKCEAELSKLIEFQCQNLRQEIRSYDILRYQLESSFTKSDLVCFKDEDVEFLETLLQTSRLDLDEISEEYFDCSKQLRMIDIDEESISTSIESELQAISVLEAELLQIRDEIKEDLELIESFSSEVMNYHSESMTPMFDIFVSDLGVCAVNGFRLRFKPMSKDFLNWSEINTAWGCLSLFVVALRNREQLTPHVNISVFSARSSELTINAFFGVRSLRRRALIQFDFELIPEGDRNFVGGDSIQTGDKFPSYSPPLPDFEATTIISSESEAWNLNLEGGDDFLGTYEEAVRHFAAFVAITAAQIFREDCLVGSIAAIWSDIKSNTYWDLGSVHWPCRSCKLFDSAGKLPKINSMGIQLLLTHIYQFHMLVALSAFHRKSVYQSGSTSCRSDGDMYSSVKTI